MSYIVAISFIVPFSMLKAPGSFGPPPHHVPRPDNCHKPSGRRVQHTILSVVFFVVVLTCAIGLIGLASFLQQLDAPLDTHPLHHTHNPNVPTQATETHADVPAPDNEMRDLAAFECVGWKARRDCSPDGGPDPVNDRDCNATVHDSESGYCAIRHTLTGHVHRVMKMHCNSLRFGVAFRCSEFATLLTYGRKATTYVHDATFSMEACRHQLIKDHVARQASKPPSRRATLPVSFERGIGVVVYATVLQSVYASVRSLRTLGCTLPIELWYKRSETDPSHPLLQALTTYYGAYLREIHDPRASTYYTKTYAVFYSAFDHVLLLDADNFAVRDPTYLFDTPQFRNHGAIFWPDFWRFQKTIFNIQPTSFVWQVFDLAPVDMFEQESGQLLIDRRRHYSALNVVMYYAFHPHVFERLRLAWGDKDLFRFAWLKTASSFHMIETPPGAAGVKLPDQNIFCGVTMVQHDPERAIVFLHRNQQKLSSTSRDKVWVHVQDFRMDEVDLNEYDVRGANGGRYFPMFKRCYGKDMNYEKAFTVQAIDDLPFAGLEQRLLGFVQEATRMEGTRKATGA